MVPLRLGHIGQVLGKVGSRLEGPGEGALDQEDHHVYEGLYIVSPALFIAEVGVEAGKAGRSCELLAIPEGDVLAILGVYVLLAKAIVNEVDYVGLSASAHAEVVRLHISVEELLAVEVFKATAHLLAQKQSSLEGELALAILVQVLQ